MKHLYFNGTIVTMAGEGNLAEAVITENGKISFVGSKEQALSLAGDDVLKVDLDGKVLLPGFIDAHGHVIQTAQGISLCDLSEAKDFESIAQLLKDYISKNDIGSDDIVFGNGYDHNFLLEGVHPDSSVLDSVSKDIPIYISHVSGHMGVGNSALFKLANVTPETEDPLGGKFGRDNKGQLNGYIEETPALMKVLMVAMPRMKMDMVNQFLLTQDRYLSYGITTCQEGAAGGADAMKLLCGIDMGKMLKMDVVIYPLDESYQDAVSQYPMADGKYMGHVKIGGTKIILDGSPQGKSAWLSKPYEGEAEYAGYPTHDDAYVRDVIKRAGNGGYQVLAHCNGDAASEQFLSACERQSEIAKLRPVMIHAQTVRRDQLERMSHIEMIPSFFVGHTYYWGDVHLKNLGKDRGSKVSPVNTAKEFGLIFNFHQDSPVTKPDMLHSVWCAVNRQTRLGVEIGPEERVSVYDALKAVTINAAYAYFEEDEKGTIEVNKKADFVVLEKNPLTVDPCTIKDIKVLRTYKDDELVWSEKCQ